jgi:hypothetical protein
MVHASLQILGRYVIPLEIGISDSDYKPVIWSICSFGQKTCISGSK